MTKSAKLYFPSYESPNSSTIIGIKRTLFHTSSKYQKIEVLESYDYGNILVLDGVIQLSAKHQFIYSEMIAHPAVFALGRGIKNTLVMGGGDGGTALELLKHKQLKIEVCELDKEVVLICKKYFPEIGNAFRNRRVKLHIDDGSSYLKKIKQKYNLIINDITHLNGNAAKLYSKKYFKLCRQKLDDDLSGLVAHASGTPFQNTNERKLIFNNIKSVFRYVHLYLASIPTYPTGLFCFIYASNNTPLTNFDSQYYERLIEKNVFIYYNKEIHFGCQKLPEFIKEFLKV